MGAGDAARPEEPGRARGEGPLAKASVARLSVLDVDRWHARVRKAGTGEGSVRNQHQALRAALTQAMRWGWVTSNVAAVASLGKRKQSPGSSMTPDEVRSVIEAAASFDPAAGAALRLAAATGARRSELAALRWDDLEGNRLTIDSSVAIIRHGSTGSPATPTLLDGATKTGNRRTITLDGTTMEMLTALRSVRVVDGPWILSDGDRPVNPERITAWWGGARKAAGLDEK